tara:strand:+ start:19 stop:195 length:177 start_codon:yes stop_codon:yes gene_type:complete
MRLPKEYRKFIGNYSKCSSAYGRKMLRKFGYGPEAVVEKVVEEVKPKAKKKTSKKKSD